MKAAANLTDDHPEGDLTQVHYSPVTPGELEPEKHQYDELLAIEFIQNVRAAVSLWPNQSEKNEQRIEKTMAGDLIDPKVFLKYWITDDESVVAVNARRTEKFRTLVTKKLLEIAPKELFEEMTRVISIREPNKESQYPKYSALVNYRCLQKSMWHAFALFELNAHPNITITYVNMITTFCISVETISMLMEIIKMGIEPNVNLSDMQWEVEQNYADAMTRTV